jgi:Fe-S-cluster containining protein
VSEPEYLPVAHDRFRRVDRNLFVRRVVADCLRHSCVMVAEEGRALHPARPLLEACCQYGADTDLGERDAILARRGQIAPLLDEAARDAPWFTTQVEEDPDYPSGRHVRTATFGGGCIFLAHDKRGCAIHRAAFEQGWDFHGVKPNICRLFPLSYDGDIICISDDYEDYDCADAPGAPTLYRVGRDTLGAIFGSALVAALDAVEATIISQPPQPPQPKLVELRARPA